LLGGTANAAGQRINKSVTALKSVIHFFYNLLLNIQQIRVFLAAKVENIHPRDGRGPAANVENIQRHVAVRPALEGSPEIRRCGPTSAVGRAAVPSSVISSAFPSLGKAAFKPIVPFAAPALEIKVAESAEFVFSHDLYIIIVFHVYVHLFHLPYIIICRSRQFATFSFCLKQRGLLCWRFFNGC